MDYSERLNSARNEGARQEKPIPVSNPIDTAKNLSKAATPMGFFSLLTKASIFKDLPFACAYCFAILKDSLDLVFGITVIVPILFSIFCSIFIYMMMLLAGSTGKKNSIVRSLKWIVLIGGGLADSFPGAAFFPIATLTVTIIYVLTLSERSNNGK